jgi:hypothetical protein
MKRTKNAVIFIVNSYFSSSAGATVPEEPWPPLRLLAIGPNPVTKIIINMLQTVLFS